MVRIVSVKALPNYQIELRFSDGVRGTVDLSPMVGKGVFKRWKEKGEFEKVHIDAESGAVAWGQDIDLCPDALYLEVTGKKIEEVFPNLNLQQPIHA